jgi:hypothetical protein
MAVNYYLRYKELFEFEKRVQKNYIKTNPRNFYRVSRYEYSDGDVKSLTGTNSSLIFVIGVHDDKVNCIKLNEVRPELFLQWMPTLFKLPITVEDIDNMKLTSDLLVISDLSGNGLFESKIKGKPLYNSNPRPYRTYNLDGLQYIQEIKLKSDILKGMI